MKTIYGLIYSIWTVLTSLHNVIYPLRVDIEQHYRLREKQLHRDDTVAKEEKRKRMTTLPATPNVDSSRYKQIWERWGSWSWERNPRTKNRCHYWRMTISFSHKSSFNRWAVFSAYYLIHCNTTKFRQSHAVKWFLFTSKYFRVLPSKLEWDPFPIKDSFRCILSAFSLEKLVNFAQRHYTPTFFFLPSFPI